MIHRIRTALTSPIDSRRLPLLALLAMILLAITLPTHTTVGQDTTGDATEPGASDPAPDGEKKPVIRIGAKTFTESEVLGHVLAHVARDAGFEVSEVKQFAGTDIVYNELVAGGVLAYVEYTGTLQQQIYAGEAVYSLSLLVRRLTNDGIGMTLPLGFNNTYVMSMKKERADELGIKTISDLKKHPDLKIGLSSEFINRGDGWGALKETYGLPHDNVKGMEHANALLGVDTGDLDVTDAYATDAEIEKFGLRLLVDDKAFFPAYEAVILYRLSSEDPLVQAQLDDLINRFRALESTLDEAAMTKLNAKAADTKQPSTVAAEWVNANRGRIGMKAESMARERNYMSILATTTGDHLFLVGVSMFFALLVAIPLGIAAFWFPKLGHVIMNVVGVFQTIPSFALLVIMVPLMGTGPLPAIIALFFYSLLPIVRNTYTGLIGIPQDIRESAAALGLPHIARLWRIELPMAGRSILAGIKIAVVLNVGTATLGAFIGAGGYGEPILSGIQVVDVGLIVAGAIPAAVMALLAQGVFELAERKLVSKGLRLKAAT